MASYPGGHEEAQADESLLPIYAGFKQTLEASGLTKLEPKASAAAAAPLNSASSARDLDSPPPAGLRSLQRTTSNSGGHGHGGDGTGGSPRATPFFSNRTASAPAFRTLPGYPARGSITGASAAAPAAPASGPPDDYLPSWIADEQDPSLLLLHSIPPVIDDSAFGVGLAHQHQQQQQMVQLSSPSTLIDDGASEANGAPADQRSIAPLLGGDQATSSPLIPARSMGSSVSPPGAAAQLDEIQLAMQ